MAAPTITRVDGVPASLAPGQSVDLTVVASDADNRTVTLRFTVTDQSGASSAPQDVTVPVTDPLTSSASVVSGGGTLTQLFALVWRYTA